MKRKASETQDSSHLIQGDSLLTVLEGVSGKLPKLTSLKGTIQPQREQVLVAPLFSWRGSCSPPEYQRTAKGERLLFYNFGPGPVKILIGTQRNLERLESSQFWLADGSFKTAPELFRQVYIIHGGRCIRSIPDCCR